MRQAGIYKSHDLYFTVHKVKTFVQGRIFRSTYDSKLIFYMRMYLRETSRNIQKLCPHNLYFTVC